MVFSLVTSKLRSGGHLFSSGIKATIFNELAECYLVLNEGS